MRHVPKGARTCTGLLLTDIINRLILDPMQLDNWRCILCFGAVILEQPRHGGKRHNLTSIIKKRTTESFDTWRIKSEVLFGDEIQSNRRGTARLSATTSSSWQQYPPSSRTEISKRPQGYSVRERLQPLYVIKHLPT